MSAQGEWFMLPASEADEIEAQRLCALVLAEFKGREKLDRGDSDASSGYLAELLVDRWLTEYQVPHVWHSPARGPVRGKPDIDIAAPAMLGRGSFVMSVDSKAMRFGARPTDCFRRNNAPWTVNILAAQLEQGKCHEYLLSTYHYPKRELYLQGGLPAQEVKRVAKFYRKGEWPHEWYQCRDDTWVVPIAAIEAPREWFWRSLRRAWERAGGR